MSYTIRWNQVSSSRLQQIQQGVTGSRAISSPRGLLGASCRSTSKSTLLTLQLPSLSAWAHPTIPERVPMYRMLCVQTWVDSLWHQSLRDVRSFQVPCHDIFITVHAELVAEIMKPCRLTLPRSLSIWKYMEQRLSPRSLHSQLAMNQGLWRRRRR